MEQVWYDTVKNQLVVVPPSEIIKFLLVWADDLIQEEPETYIYIGEL